MKKSLFFLFFLFVLNSKTMAIEPSRLSDRQAVKPLALEECINIAIANHPALQASLKKVDASAGKVKEAKAPYYPQVGVNSAYEQSHSTTFFTGQESVTDTARANVTLNQLLFDFGKTRASVDASMANKGAEREDLERVRQRVIYGVKEAYFGLLKASRIARLQEEALNQARAHLRQARAFFEAGVKPKFDVTQAEVEVNSAELDLLKARHSKLIAQATLNNRMGLDPGTPVEIEDTMTPKEISFDLNLITEEALSKRAEVRVLGERIVETEAQIRIARGGALPTLSAQGNYLFQEATYESGGAEVDIGNSWSVGLSLNFTLFDGFQTSSRVAQAKANLENLRLQHKELKLDILLEIKQAYLTLEETKERIALMVRNLAKARENLQIAQGRYEVQVGTLLEVTDAQVAYTSAETDQIQASYDYQLAIARLEKAIGR